MIEFTKNSEQAALASKNNRNAIRQKTRLLRQRLTPTQQNEAAIHLLASFSIDEKIISAKSIALYLSNDGELDTQLLIEWCWQQGKQVYLPVLHPFATGHLLFLHYDSQTPLVENHFGIAEPKLDVRKIIPPQQLDIICTPLVAFDNAGARLGMGGGFYDRTLSHWHQHHQQQSVVKPYPIGLAHDCQLVGSLPSESWDIPLPEIITPSLHFKFD
ncbi:MAG: 5-formyltetrahydrofolate cyclo-ligase [Cognaticolwellia sp.]